MSSLKLLHAGYQSLAALDGLGIVAAGAESAHRAVALHADHALRGSEVEEVFLQLLVLVGHHEADIIDDRQFDSISNDCGKIAATLTKIIKTVKNSAEK